MLCYFSCESSFWMHFFLQAGLKSIILNPGLFCYMWHLNILRQFCKRIFLDYNIYPEFKKLTKYKHEEWLSKIIFKRGITNPYFLANFTAVFTFERNPYLNKQDTTKHIVSVISEAILNYFCSKNILQEICRKRTKSPSDIGKNKLLTGARILCKKTSK